MNFKIIIPILFLLVMVPVMSTTIAQEDAPISLSSNESSVKIISEENLRLYAFVQIIHRDSNGNLVSYIESDKISTIDYESMLELLSIESSRDDDPIYSVHGKFIEVIVRQQITHIDTITLSTDTQLLSAVNDKDGKSIEGRIEC